MPTTTTVATSWPVRANYQELRSTIRILILGHGGSTAVEHMPRNHFLWSWVRFLPGTGPFPFPLPLLSFSQSLLCGAA